MRRLSVAGAEMPRNPEVDVTFANGQLQPVLSFGTGVPLKLGVSTGGPTLRGVMASQTAKVLEWLHGPLVKSAAFHVTYSGPCRMMRMRSSVVGSIGAVTKSASAAASTQSRGVVAASLSTYIPHAPVGTVAAASALSLTTGWQTPPAPLPIKVSAGASTVAHVLTFSYVDDAGETTTGTLSVTGVGDFTTDFAPARVLSMTSNIAPVGAQSYSATFSSPADRYPMRIAVDRGGVLGVIGGTLPRVRVSLDDEMTWSRVQDLPTSGVFEILSYAGGLRAQATGVTLTLTNATALGDGVRGSTRVLGATSPAGDLVVTKLTDAATTFAVVVAGNSTPLSVAVVGNVVTLNAATDAGGLATTTAAAAAAFVNADATASQLVFLEPAGTGLGLLATRAAAGFADAGVNYVPKLEGVRVRHADPGPSNPTIKVQTIGLDVVVTPVTDSGGAQTSTATQVAAAVNGDAAASRIVMAAPTGTGSGIVGVGAPYRALAVTLATGDSFALDTTPPKWSQVDLEEALAAVRRNDALLDAIECLHLVGEADDVAVATVHEFLADVEASKRKWKNAVLEGRFMGDTPEAVWKDAEIAEFRFRTNLLGVVEGEANQRNPAYGTVDRTNFGTPYMARLMNCPISELPSHVDCDTLTGIQGALPGVLERPSGPQAGQDDPPLWQTDDALQELHARSFVTARKFSGRAGIYVRQGLTFCNDGDDYQLVDARRIADFVAPIGYDVVLRNLNANLLTDPETGKLAQVEIERIQNDVEAAVVRGAMGGQRRHLVDVRCVVDPDVDFVHTGEISADLKLLKRTAATFIGLSIGYVPELAQ